MKGSSIRLVLVIVGLAAAVALGAQTTERELTVEELYLRDIEFQILSEKAFSDSREIKLDVLDGVILDVLRDSISGDAKESFDLQVLLDRFEK